MFDGISFLLDSNARTTDRLGMGNGRSFGTLPAMNVIKLIFTHLVQGNTI